MKLPFTLLAALALTATGSSTFAATGEEIIVAQKCNKCHTATSTKKGPSYASVAAKYKGKPEAATMLFKGLKAGGKMGDEDDHKKLELPDDDIKAVVAAVLASK